MKIHFISVLFVIVFQIVNLNADAETNAFPDTSAQLAGSNDQSPVLQLSAYEKYRDLFQLTASNFSKNVLGKIESWVVVFHENGTFATGWKSMAASLRGIVWVGVVNVKDDHKIFTKQNLKMKEVPPALVYPYGNKKVKMSKVEAAHSPLEAKSMAVKSIPDVFEVIASSTVQPFMMDCFTTGLSRFPVILIQSNRLPSPLFKAIALRFQKYFNFGLLVNPSVDDLKVLGLQNIYFDFPSFLVMVTTDQVNLQLNAIVYNKEEMGDMNYPNLVRFLFYINNEYRYLLPGDNRSNQEEEARMTDILEIEEERFQFVDESTNGIPKSKGSRTKNQNLKYKEDL